MGKALMATQKQIENCKILIMKIDEKFSQMDESTKKTVGRYNWEDVEKIRIRLLKGVEFEKRSGVTQKMYYNLVSFAEQIFGIKIPNAVDFINDKPED